MMRTTYRVKTQHVHPGAERPSADDYWAAGAEWGLDDTAADDMERLLVVEGDVEAAEDLMETDPAVVRYEVEGAA